MTNELKKAIETVKAYLDMDSDVDSEYLNAQRMIIQALESHQWIPVSERLPEDYGEYICTMSDDNVQECGFIPIGKKGLIPGWSTCEADGFKKLDYRDVIAWMPPPQHYKEESVDEE